MPDLSRLTDLGWFHPEVFGRLLLAAFLGGLVGLEREWSGKPAGFRTNLLICLGAALITTLSQEVAQRAGAPADAGRIAAQVVSGIGFLGAGTIIQSRGSVVGLTTAATLWVVAAIGMNVGAGSYGDAVVATGLVMLTLMLLAQFEPTLRHREEHVVRVTMRRDPRVVKRVESLLEERFTFQVSEAERREKQVTFEYEVSGRSSEAALLVNRLLEIEGVRRVMKQ